MPGAARAVVEGSRHRQQSGNCQGSRPNREKLKKRDQTWNDKDRIGQRHRRERGNKRGAAERRWWLGRKRPQEAPQATGKFRPGERRAPETENAGAAQTSEEVTWRCLPHVTNFVVGHRVLLAALVSRWHARLDVEVKKRCAQ